MNASLNQKRGLKMSGKTHNWELQFITGILSFSLSSMNLFPRHTMIQSKKLLFDVQCPGKKRNINTVITKAQERQSVQLNNCGSSPPDNSLLPHKLGNGICHTMMVDTISSCLGCFVFLLILLWPSPPDTTNTELTFTLWVRLAFWKYAGSFSRSYIAPSSGPCSKEPWDKARDPHEEDKESWRTGAWETELVLLFSSCVWFSVGWDPSTSWAPGWHSLGVLDVSVAMVAWETLHTAVAMVRNLTGPWWAWKETMPRPEAKRRQKEKSS